MIGQSFHIRLATEHFNPESCRKDTWLVLLHAQRIPPHVGLMINGSYNSLTVKGHELNISFEVIHKTIQQKNIETAFIKIADHPVFSQDYQLAVFHEIIKGFSSVKQNEATCLSPVREFFEEFYAVKNEPEELLFDFIDRLNKNKFLEKAFGYNFELDQGLLEMPYYTSELLHEKIRSERLPFYND